MYYSVIVTKRPCFVNRTEVVYTPMKDGMPGGVSDFCIGWLRENGSNWGRPVDVVTGPDGSLFASDDGQGHIYRIFYAGQ
jgi:glucose/arabinose dehydrogenase